jgi:hypothetical protein
VVVIEKTLFPHAGVFFQGKVFLEQFDHGLDPGASLSRSAYNHSGFNVYCGNAIWPHNEESLENLRVGSC